MNATPKQADAHDQLEDFEDFFEYSMCGFVNAAPDGVILRANSRLAGWLGYTAAELIGIRFSELLRVGGKIMYETHLAPLLRMQGSFQEVALEMRHKDGEITHVLMNARERRSADGTPLFIRLTIFKATDRRLYEQNLQLAKTTAERGLTQEKDASKLREQFIAVLGHDLRNPLNAITGGVQLLARAPLDARFKQLVEMMKDSTSRMAELIANVMDFARGRLGGGMSITRTPTVIEPILTHVFEELRSAYPARSVTTEFSILEPVDCDAARISQVLSNLLANALTHGARDKPVLVRGVTRDAIFELSVSNSGRPIPPASLARLFEPFVREDARSSQNGLGLGLFIAAEITRAHGGTLSATSDENETRFTFQMPLLPS